MDEERIGRGMSEPFAAASSFYVFSIAVTYVTAFVFNPVNSRGMKWCFY